ncbi:MAG: hypothetical protein LBT21_05705 [Oscillospiraceae bacterium]|nr:hypothetical protein [Oscillospiraceae bacterium]
MVRIFKLFRFIFCLLSIAGAIILILFGMSLVIFDKQIFPIANIAAPSDELTGFYGGLYLLFILINYLWIFVCAKKKLRKIENILLCDCDAKKYISAYRQVLSQSKSAKYKAVLIYGLSYGYLMAGDYENALKTEQQLDYITLSPSDKFLYLSILFSYNFAVDEIKTCAAILKNMEIEIARIPQANNEKTSAQRMLSNLSMQYKMKLDIHPDFVEYFESELLSASHKLEKVTLTFLCAKALLLNSSELNYEIAKKLTYVAKNGGRTIYAKQAKKLLSV